MFGNRKSDTPAGDYLRDFFGRRRPNRVDPTTKNSIRHDRWDREDLGAIMAELKDIELAQEELLGVTETGDGAIEDTFFSLMKAEPDLKGGGEMRPSYLINRAVMEEATGLSEWEKLRLSTTGDPVSAGLATAEMEPELEKIFDRLKEAQDMANSLEGMAGEYESMEQALEDIERMMAEAQGGGNEAQLEDYQQQQARIQEAMDRLQKQMEQKAEEIDGNLRENAPQVGEHLRNAAEEAQDQADNMDNMSTAWGLEPGQLQRLPAQKRIELAKRMNTEKFKRLAQLIGPMTRLAFAEQQRKTVFARDEVYDVTLGNDINRVLPTEIMLLGDEGASLDFYRRYVEGHLMEYKLQGTERIAKGGIIFCEDGSGSMGGDREVWAKAVGLALLHIARRQNREFYGIHFGSPGEYVTFDFDTSFGAWVEGEGGGYSSRKKYEREYYDQIDAVMFFAELFFGSGTDFVTPLTVALDKLREQHRATGAVQGDIVFVTDGQCGVDNQWLEEFMAEKERLGFKVWGIVIGGNPKGEPLYTICDHQVFLVDDLMHGGDVSEVFRNV